MKRIALALSLLVSSVSAAAAQSDALRRAAETISEADVRRRIGIIADDSMMGRDTPSKGLEMTAAYIADQFKRFGLKPGGDAGSYLQRYSICTRALDGGASTVTMKSGAAASTTSFRKGARLVSGPCASKAVGAPAVLVGGPLTARAVAAAGLEGKTVVYVIDQRHPTQAQDHALALLNQAHPAALVLLSNRDTATFGRRLASQLEPELIIGGGGEAGVVVEVQERSMRAALSAAGVEPDQVRASREPVVREVPGLFVSVTVRQRVTDNQSAPNVVGVLEGSDPALKDEYIVVSAHMDHIGIAPGAADSINNGADDDGSGTAGVMELAEAFSQPDARPKRSMIFLTVSGEEKGLWGSSWFVDHPPVPIDQIVADLNMDMIGRNWKDTIVAIGREHSDLGATLERVRREHRELRMTPIGDIWPQEGFYFRSDHYNFARKGVPILFFFNGTHADYHEPSDSPDKIDAEKESRILRLIFYLGEEIGNAPKRPQWNPDSYRRIVQKP